VQEDNNSLTNGATSAVATTVALVLLSFRYDEQKCTHLARATEGFGQGQDSFERDSGFCYDHEMRTCKDIDAYIAKAPKEVRAKLEEIRKAIREVAPNAAESISYGMPGYDKGRIAWFGLMKRHIGLYLRPPIIEEHKNELKGYTTTKSAVHFPLDKKLPIALIKRLVRARIKKNES